MDRFSFALSKLKAIFALGLAIIIISLLVVVFYHEMAKPDTSSNSKDLDFILKGVNNIKVKSSVFFGLQTIYGNNSFPILAWEADAFMHPVISAGRYEKGRFAAYAHKSCLLYANSSKSSKYDNDKLFGNIAIWAASSNSSKHKSNITAGLFCVSVPERKYFQRVLSQRGIAIKNTVHCTDTRELKTLEFLKQHDLIILNGHWNSSDFKDEEAEALQNYVASGGGVILGANSWSLDESYSHPLDRNRTLPHSYWGNKILNLMGGVAFVDHIYSYTDEGGIIHVKRSTLEDTNAYQVWTKLKKMLHNPKSVKTNKLSHMKVILKNRIEYAPRDNNFTEEVLDEIAILLTPPKQYKSTANIISHYFSTGFTMWFDFQNALENHKFIQKEYLDKMIKELKEFMNSSNIVMYSTIMQDVITEIIMRIRLAA